MWGAIEADFDREYHHDLSLPGFLRSKTWRWFCVRLHNLSGEAMTRHVMREQRRADPRATMDALNAAARRG